MANKIFKLNNAYLKTALESIASDVSYVKYETGTGTWEQATIDSTTVSSSLSLQIMITIPWTDIGATGYVDAIQVYTGSDVLVGELSGIKLMSPNNEALLYMVIINTKQFIKNTDGQGSWDESEE